MLEYYNNRLCIPAGELVGAVMTSSCYNSLVQRGRVTVARRGGGAGQYALVVVDSLPSQYRVRVDALYPTADGVRVRGWIMSNYEVDQAAVAWFHDRAKTGIDLSEEKKREYVVNASVLNTCIRLYENARERKKIMGERYNWDMMAGVIEALREELGHTLPSSTLRFRKKVNEYMSTGYGCLVSGKFGNQSARKVDHKTERLIISLATMPNKPFNTSVLEMYNSFVCGELEVYDPETGELLDAEDYQLKSGEPKSLSESTICNVLNKPKNKVLIDHALYGRNTFMHEMMPHMHRHSGEFSLSQITMDDVDLTRKLKDTKQRVHAYYAYDVVSQCVVGASYSRMKDQGLVVDCFRDMFRLIEKKGWGMPAGIEVENHLMSEYKDGLLLAGVAFPFVHFCAAQNSQEKYAEAMNGAKKKSVIHKNHEGIGRFYGKGKWRTESTKVSDATNELWDDKEYFSWEQLVAEDRADNMEWNNALHPNQKKYPGMTRWEVLEANINPTLKPYDKLMLSRYIGEKVETSVRRNSTVRVAYSDWWLSSTRVLEKLEPNNYKVTAYYIPNEAGEAEDVYLFQGDRYIDKVEKVETYNRVMAEQTDEDVVKFIEQRKKVSSFVGWVKEHAVSPLGVQRKANEAEEPTAAEPLEVIADTEMEDSEWKGYDAFANLPASIESL